MADEKKIVIVDDDKEILSELELLLKPEGYKTVACADAGAAVETILKTSPDLVLLDLKMDKVSGFQVADRLKDFGDTKDIPIIAMTGHFSDEE